MSKNCDFIKINKFPIDNLQIRINIFRLEESGNKIPGWNTMNQTRSNSKLFSYFQSACVFCFDFDQIAKLKYNRAYRPTQSANLCQ